MLLQFCRLVGHRRDIRRVRPSTAGWRSECSFCAEPMIRLASGHWSLERDRLRVELQPRLPAPQLQIRPDSSDRVLLVVRDLFEPDDGALS